MPRIRSIHVPTPVRNLSLFLEAIAFLGPERIQTHANLIQDIIQSSLAVAKAVPAILYPKSVSEVQGIVQEAARYGVKLYPVSRGRNIGYGELSPAKNHQVVVSLERMNQIREFDPDRGVVTIEPGVSQIQLVEFLSQHGSGWIADVTGAPPDASIVGNALDGGFGHTPLGNHREHILDVEIVLGTGELLTTGTFPGLGPNLAPLFVQSNFGIVTAMQIPLLRRPDVVLTYTVQFPSTEMYLRAIPKIRELRSQGVIQSLLHIANATRVYMSTNSFPPNLPKSSVLSDEDCRRLMQIPLIKAPHWAGVGGLYGTRRQTNEAVRILKRELGEFGRVQIFSDFKFGILRKVAKLALRNSSSILRSVMGSLDSLQAIHGLCQGIPTEKPSAHMRWKLDQDSKPGLIWISPVVDANSNAPQKLLQILHPIFSKFSYELPITMTFIDPRHLVCIVNICFDRSDPSDTRRAHQAFRACERALAANHIRSYRKGILYQQFGIPKDRLKHIQLLKAALDPKGIIAPGRYGIWNQ